jgi:hypothetical protein
MDNIFFDLPAVFGYLDDLLIGSRPAAEHRRHLREVLGRLQANGLLLNTEKCEWGLRKVDFLRHTVSAAGIAPLPDRVAAIREFSPPQTVEQLQAFLGLFNFYRRFVPGFSGRSQTPSAAPHAGRRNCSGQRRWSPPSRRPGWP